ncbi:glycoside hydrolase family 97 protein [Fulvivirga ligni]|uniref:glycoside hydrolase family 97 protein n=1 Tax=Fulvivirga ligni TaxID=2904246 RepID=UPI001F46F7EA|nr:glycoside hydrolase family 97 protein [Fulvivirga ligni]UII21219.1 glycoside hydrolase family 97 protein [Fulvivirga ligni]
MKQIYRWSLLYFTLFLVLTSCSDKDKATDTAVSSPNGQHTIQFKLTEKGEPYYTVTRNGVLLIDDSRLGFEFADQPHLKDQFEIESSEVSDFDETWSQPWGEVKDIRNNYQQLKVVLKEKAEAGRKLNIIFRAYDDGVAFRYEIPTENNMGEYKVTNELSEFNLTQNYDAWWIPAYGDNTDYEALFNKNKLADLKENIHTPLTMELGDSLFVSIHEASLIDYAGMTLKPEGTKLSADLVPWSTGEKVRANGALVTPWRTVQIAPSAGDLITSYLILNLNEPNKIGNTDWIEPGKYNGIWWGMHINTQTWNSGDMHGATTKNTKELIDFASNNNLSGVLVEGWNIGWDDDWSSGNFNFSKPYPDYDVEELSSYAKEKGVGLIAHHETGGNIENYEKQLDDALAFMDKHNIHALKTGYVCKLANGKEYHQSQFMVNHYNKVMKATADHHIMLDVHEPVKATGLRRTYPNMMTREGARGTEYEAWSAGNPPSHTLILPFTRCLAGPLDYTPGIFDITIANKPENRVHTTLAKQLALYVTIYSPLQMAADLPEHYADQPAFQFIRDVPTDWEKTEVLNAKIGDYLTIARKDRNGDDWYLGSTTSDDAKQMEVTLSFLTPGKTYEAQIYADGEGADMETNPLAINMESIEVNSETVLPIKLAPGGGQAIRFHLTTN